MKLLDMLFRRGDPPPIPDPPEVESKVEEIAAAQVKSDATRDRLHRVLSARDARVKAAVVATGAAVRSDARRSGGS